MEKPEISEQTINEDDTRCRFLCCLRFKWTDILAKPKIFLLIYSGLTSLEGMLFAYFIGSMTTFEEHFQLKSESLGIVMSFAEIIPVFTALIGAYLGGTGDRPRWVAGSMFLIGIACFIITLPYYIFGVPPRGDTGVNVSSSDDFTSFRLCSSDAVHDSNLNISNTCKVASAQENNVYAVALCLLGFTINVNGCIMLFIIGTPYMDDNVQQKNSPTYIGVTCAMRSIGPLLGFLLSYLCLSIYVNPTENINLSPDDPEWIGAWWLGYLILGTLTILGGFLIGQFPIRLPSRHATTAMKMINVVSNDEKKIREENEEKNSFFDRFYASIKEVLPTLRRVMTNVPFILRVVNGVFTFFPLEGIFVYLPKYMEHQFRLTQSEASIWTGTILIAPNIVGTVAVGYLIHRMQPTTRQLTIAIVISKIIFAVTLLSLISLNCDDEALVLGLGDGTTSLPCDNNCDCSPLPFAPICGSDGKNYLSGCHAGCTFVNRSIDTWIYQNCSCIPDGRAAVNLCSKKCPLFSVYVIVMFICNFLLSIQIVGEVVIILRCVLVKDKSIAMGIYSSVLSLLVFIPIPLVFSSIVDSSCSLWSYTCGQRGNCLLYDLSSFRYLMHSVPAGLLIVAILVDMLFWYKARDIALFDDGDKEENSQNQNVTDPTETVW